MTEYIIVSKTSIEERIKGLEGIIQNLSEIHSYEEVAKICVLKEVLSQSTPLIPEIDKAYEAGKLDKELSLTFDYPKGRYIGSLKLNINIPNF